MADTKITALTALTGADPANDVIPIVDVSDTTMAASGTTKKISVNNILGASGTATLASATITGDLTVDTNTLKVDSANNRVGVGTASPAVTCDVAGPIRSIVSGGTPYLYLNNGTSQHSLSNDSNALSISVFAAEQMRIAASGVFTWYDGAGGTRMTLNSTGLGVGVSPGSAIGNLQVGGSSNANLYVQQGTDTIRMGVRASGRTGIILDSSNATYTNRAWYLDNAGSSGSLVIGRQGLDVITFDNSGNCGIGVTPAGTGGCLQLKSGITFPATQVASSDPNTLDDYEEGSWTPVVADASTGGNTGTCTINSAKYVKIGRQVSVQCDISGITTTGMTAGNPFYIRGLPFTSVQGGDGNFYTYRVGRDAATVSASAHVSDASSVVGFFLYTTNSATTDKTLIVSNIVSTTSQIILSVTYFV